MNPRYSRTGFMLLLGAVIGAGSCSSPSKATPVDPYPDGPKVACPAAPSPVTSPTGAATVVQYGTATASGGAPPINTTCTPPSGANFNVGSTTVTCIATDARQRTDSCSLSVVVQQPPRLTTTSFVSFGDSITAGEDGISNLTVDSVPSPVRPRFLLPVPRRYPSVLETSLKGRYTTQNPTVANAGQPEEKAGSNAALVRFGNVLAQGSFGAVLIMEGSNDLNARDSGEIPATIQGFRNMIQTARGRNVRPFLATIPPMVPNTLRGLAWSLVPALNSGIRSLAASENVTLVDIEGAFGTSYQQYIGFDGLHPNAEGHAKIAETFFGVIRSTLEAPSPATTSLPNAHIRTRGSR